jgi:hypothetical protein
MSFVRLRKSADRSSTSTGKRALAPTSFSTANAAASHMKLVHAGVVLARKQPSVSLPGRVMTFGNDALRCPRCLELYLHHEAVTVFNRGEDAERTTVTSIRDGHANTSIMNSSECENPSSRRHGLTISFWCEMCDAKPVLTLAQHKGQTFFAWRDGGRKLDARLMHWESTDVA